MPSAQKSLTFTLSIILLSLTVLSSVIFGILCLWKMQNIKNLDQQISEKKQELERISSQEINSINNVQQKMKLISKDLFIWEPYVSEIIARMPRDVLMLSLATDRSERVTVQAVSSNVQSVSTTIKQFLGSGFFEKVFVPSVSSGIAQDQTPIVSFPLILNVKKDYIPTENVNINTNNNGFINQNNQENSNENLNNNDFKEINNENQNSFP